MQIASILVRYLIETQLAFAWMTWDYLKWKRATKFNPTYNNT